MGDAGFTCRAMFFLERFETFRDSRLLRQNRPDLRIEAALLVRRRRLNSGGRGDQDWKQEGQ